MNPTSLGAKDSKNSTIEIGTCREIKVFPRITELPFALTLRILVRGKVCIELPDWQWQSDRIPPETTPRELGEKRGSGIK
jgi:hypothetical protein